MKSPTPTRERIIAKLRFHLIFVAAVVVMRSARRRLANKRRKFDIVYVTTAKLFCGFRPSRAPNKPGDFGPADPQRTKPDVRRWPYVCALHMCTVLHACDGSQEFGPAASQARSAGRPCSGVRPSRFPSPAGSAASRGAGNGVAVARRPRSPSGAERG